MQTAGALMRSAVGAQAGAAAAPALLRLSGVLASRLGGASWPHAAQLSSSAKDQQQPEQAPEQPEASSSSSAGGASSAAAEEAAGGASSSAGDAGAGFGGFRQHFASFASRLGAGGGGGGGDEPPQPLGARAAAAWARVRHEVSEAVLPKEEGASLTRAYEGPVYQAPDAAYEGPTALAAVKAPQGAFDRLLADLYDRFGHHPIFAKLRRVDIKDSTVYKKGAELADDLRDRYETSDHPAVHKVEDVKEKLFGMSETAAAMALIRGRDPRFDMSRLLEGVRYDAPRVVKAFLTHDLPTLRKHCGPELLERLEGIFKHFEAEGLYEDPTILFTGEPELVELKMVEEEPLVVVQFACQQLKCTRDKFGNVLEGDTNTIQKVFYFWGLQQEASPTVLPDGRVLPPRWVIKDMMWQSMLALHLQSQSTMGQGSSKVEAKVDKVAGKAEKVLKNVSGDIKKSSKEVKKTVNQAVDKTNNTVDKTSKGVNKAINDHLGKDDRVTAKDAAIAVPIVVLVVAGGVWLWKNKPWKKSGGKA
ncbi:TIM44-2 [Scenedesmus sp. PABB004]|nr:TIM44-2 [Scenedesmus sp. PABB004]